MSLFLLRACEPWSGARMGWARLHFPRNKHLTVVLAGVEAAAQLLGLLSVPARDNYLVLTRPVVQDDVVAGLRRRYTKLARVLGDCLPWHRIISGRPMV